MKRLLVVAALILAACSAPASAPERPARIDIERLEADHAFAPLLARYDADVATLRAANRTPAFARMRARLDNDASAIDREIADARTHVKDLGTRPVRLAAPQTAPAKSPDAAVVRQFARALERRFARAHAYHEQQAREKEATVALDFDRAHLARRLRLELRLRNDLYLQHRTGVVLRAQLAALDAAREAAVAAQRRIDAQTIARDDARLRAAFAIQMNALARDVAEHERRVAEIPTPRVGALPRDFTQPRDRTQQTNAAFAHAASDLHGRFTELGRIDDGARADADAEILALLNERQELAADIRASIRSRAADIARARGLGRVYEHDAPSGSVDITSAVAASMEQGDLATARK